MQPKLLVAAAAYTMIVAIIQYLDDHLLAGLLHLIAPAVVSGYGMRCASRIFALAVATTWGIVDALHGHVSATPSQYPMYVVLELSAAVGIVVLAHSFRRVRASRPNGRSHGSPGEDQITESASLARAAMRRIERDGSLRPPP